MPGLGIGLGVAGKVRNSNSFSPLSLAPLAWWDWSDTTKLYTDSGLTTLVASDGDPIGGVKDKSASGYNLTQTDGTAKGLYKTGINNGRSVGRTDGVNDFWQVAGSESFFKCLHYSGATVFFAGKAGTTLNASGSYGVMGTSADSTLVGYDFAYYRDGGSNIGQPLIYNSNGSAATLTTLSKTIFNNMFPSNTPVLITHKLDPQNATAANRVTVYRGSGSAVTGNTNTAAPSSGNSTYPLTFGARIAAGGTKTGYGPNDFYEIIIYASLLSDANRTLVTNYLLNKWAVT